MRPGLYVMLCSDAAVDYAQSFDLHMQSLSEHMQPSRGLCESLG